MAAPARHSSTGGPSTPGMPRWVKVLVTIAVVLVLLFVIMQFTGLGGGHGPGRHLPSHGPGDSAATYAAAGHDQRS